MNHVCSEHYSSRALSAYCVLCTMFDGYCMCHHVCGRNLYASVTVHTVCKAGIALYIITLSVKHHSKVYTCVYTVYIYTVHVGCIVAY